MFKQTLTRLLPAACAALMLTLPATGCVYRMTIQQGNFLEQDEIEQVTVGMTRKQVLYVLGTPMVADPFRSERWDYVYYLQRGRLQEPERRHFTVYFDGDRVTRIERSEQRSS